MPGTNIMAYLLIPLMILGGILRWRKAPIPCSIQIAGLLLLETAFLIPAAHGYIPSQVDSSETDRISFLFDIAFYALLTSVPLFSAGYFAEGMKALMDRRGRKTEISEPAA